MKKTLRQQGDVLLYSNAKIPNDAEEVKPISGRLILAEGEVTGHAHAISLKEFPNSKLFKNSSGTFLRICDPVILKHEEHDEVSIAPGEYEIKIVQEVDPFTDEIRSVQD